MSWWAKFRRLSFRDKKGLVQSLFLMLVFWVALRLLPFGTLYRWLSRTELAGSSPSGREQDEAAGMARSIRRANRLLGWRDDCLPQALTALFLMKRHGIGANLRIGVKKGPDGMLHAHAWVEHDGKVVVGGTGPGLQSYTPLTGLERVTL